MPTPGKGPLHDAQITHPPPGGSGRAIASAHPPPRQGAHSPPRGLRFACCGHGNARSWCQPPQLLRARAHRQHCTRSARTKKKNKAPALSTPACITFASGAFCGRPLQGELPLLRFLALGGDPHVIRRSSVRAGRQCALFKDIPSGIKPWKPFYLFDAYTKQKYSTNERQSQSRDKAMAIAGRGERRCERHGSCPA